MPQFQVINGGEEALPQPGIAEYLWIDSHNRFHSRIRTIEVFNGTPRIERWTGELDGKTVLLFPAQIAVDPFRPWPAYVVLCETRNLQMIPVGGGRPAFREYLSGGKDNPHIDEKDKFQPPATLTYEFTYHGEQSPNGYRAVAEHLAAVLDSGLYIQSAVLHDNASQWSFRVGPRGFRTDEEDPLKHMLTTCDHFLIVRYLLNKAAREHEFEPHLGPGNVLVREPVGGLRPKDICDGLAPLWTTVLTPEGVSVRTPPRFDPYRFSQRLLTNISGLVELNS